MGALVGQSWNLLASAGGLCTELGAEQSPTPRPRKARPRS